MNVLAIDVGGTNVKVLATGGRHARKVPSGPMMTPQAMMVAVLEVARDWKYDVVSIGYPGRVVHGQITQEPRNLAPGWTRFDFERAFACPVRIMNDAAMQALGSYEGGEMLFLGFGTGLGCAIVVHGLVVPIELSHLPYRKGSYEDYVGVRGLKRLGRRKWERHVHHGVERLIAALHPTDVVLGGGNAKRLKRLPPQCRAGDNGKALIGGFRMWEESPNGKVSARTESSGRHGRGVGALP